MLQVIGAYYRDDFTRADNTSLGSNWRGDLTPSRLVSNRAQAKVAPSNTGRQGGWQTYQGPTVSGGNSSGKFMTDNYIVRAQLAPPSTAAATDNSVTIIIGSSDTFGGAGTTQCYFSAATGTGSSPSGCAIITCIGAVQAAGMATTAATQTIRVSTTTAVANTDLIELKRIGNVYTAYKNGSQLLTWTDSGNVMLKGATQRRWGFQQECNYPFFQQQFSCPSIEWIEAYDLAV